MESVNIEIHKLVGEFAITLDDGEKIYAIIHPAMQKGQPVNLDFSGVRIFGSPFMNAAIGHLLQDFQSEELNRLLLIDRDKITPVGLSILRRVIENAKAYYADPLVRDAVEQAIAEYLED
ncbi:MAG: STAS-like domain-containing protein [Chloroflexota bacterium]|nr:STAS-like domain-containing protein [Chloroflexota bacterium]